MIDIHLVILIIFVVLVVNDLRKYKGRDES